MQVIHVSIEVATTTIAIMLLTGTTITHTTATTTILHVPHSNTDSDYIF